MFSLHHGRPIKTCIEADCAEALTARSAAFATLGYHPSGDLLDRLGHHAAGIIRTFRPQATSNALW